MDYIKMKLRRLKRRNRIPHGFLVSVSAVCAVLVLTALIGTSLLALPASAKMGMRMPRTEDGIVTDGDGIIESGDMLPEGSDIPPAVSDMIPDGDGSAEGESILPDGTGSDTESESGTLTTDTTGQSQTTDGATTTGAMDDVVEESNAIAWVIGLVVLAAVVIAVILIIRWASGARRDR